MATQPDGPGQADRGGVGDIEGPPFKLRLLVRHVPNHPMISRMPDRASSEIRAEWARPRGLGRAIRARPGPIGGVAGGAGRRLPDSAQGRGWALAREPAGH